MGRIYIDTDELRDIASDLRVQSAQLGDVLLDLRRGMSTTWIAPPTGVTIGGRHEWEQLQTRLLATKISEQSLRLEAEAAMRDAGEGIAGVLGGLTGFFARVGRSFYSWPEFVRWGGRVGRRTSRILRQIRNGLAGLGTSIFGPGFATPTTVSGSFGGGRASDYLSLIDRLDAGVIAIVKVSGGPPPKYTVAMRGVAGPDRGDPTDWSGAATTSKTYREALRKALARAGVPAGAELMLIGHSQGGMAANLFAMSSGPYKVTHVLTAGSPFVHSQISPYGTHTLALVNEADMVMNASRAMTPIDLSLRPTHEFVDTQSSDWAHHESGDIYADELRRVEQTDTGGRWSADGYLESASSEGYLTKVNPDQVQYFQLHDTEPAIRGSGGGGGGGGGGGW